MWAGVSIGARACASVPRSAQTVNREHAAARRGLSGRPGMQTALVQLLLVATAACALARPPDPTPGRVMAMEPVPRGPHRQRVPIPEAREYLLPRFLLPHFLGYDDSPRMPPPPERTVPDHSWLNKEIDRISQMSGETEPVIRPYDDDLAHWIARDPYLQRIFENPVKTAPRRKLVLKPMDMVNEEQSRPHQMLPLIHEVTGVNKRPEKPASDDRKPFALTPLDKGYYESEPSANNSQEEVITDSVNVDEPIPAMVMEPPRQIRQNPNLSRTKTLVTENIDKLRNGLNTHEEGLMSEKGRDHIHVLDGSSDPIDPLFFAAVGGLIAAAGSLAIFGFTFAWWLAKKAKAAADVDYPAYGVTGPTVDSSGDRKLAHSAHMYHYQHQKQQIIAMESRMDMEQRLGSVSDPESEEENEEGDYTVYECPGFATTGDMEVKNPLFSDDPTPATPGKCEVVKPQPKD